jgi:hypothetical protein
LHEKNCSQCLAALIKVSKESLPTIPCTTTISNCSKARKKTTIFKESFKARVGNNKHLKNNGKVEAANDQYTSSKRNVTN